MRLGVRLLLGIFLLAGLATYATLAIFSQEVKPGVRQGMEIALVDTANLLAEAASQDLAQGDFGKGHLAAAARAFQHRPLVATVWGRTKDHPGLRIYVTDDRGRVVWDSEGQAQGQDFSRWNDVARTLQGQYGARSTRTDPHDPRTSSMHVAAPIFREGRIAGVLTVVAPTASLLPYADRSERRVRIAGGILIGASLLLGLAFTAWLLRDIGRLRAYAREVGTEGRTPLPRLGSPELAELGAALEAMRTRLDGRAYVERYVHTLTHEMKSPLAAIRGAAELLREPLPEEARDRFLANILDQEVRLRDLVDRMLALAALQHRQAPAQRDAVDLDALVARVVASRNPQATLRGLDLRVEGHSQPVRGESFLLEQAVGNLLDNALAFSPDSAVVTLRLEGTALEVLDEGPGVPDYALDQVFSPFYALPHPDGARGTGLGLCFVREIAQLHGGTATLENRAEGGARARLTLQPS